MKTQTQPQEKVVHYPFEVCAQSVDCATIEKVSYSVVAWR